MRLVFGPRENRARPAIDPLFHTAAHNFGPRVIGVVLSGTMDDGANGLATIKRRGGLAIVQDPDDAAFPEMPRNALAATQGDAISATSPDQQFVGLTCPECHGPIYVSQRDDSLSFRCIVGHRYSPEVMRAAHARRVEDALWSAVASLREHATLLKKMTQHLPERAHAFTTEAEWKEQHARELESLIEHFSRSPGPAST